MKKSILSFLFLVFLLSLTTLDGLVFGLEKRNDFEDWLKGYNANDVLDSVLAEKDQVPSVIMTRANSLLGMGKSQEVISLLEKRSFSNDPSFESQRLWSLFQAYRSLEHHNQALVSFLQLNQSMPREEFVRLCSSEASLFGYLRDVWLYWAWMDAKQKSTQEYKNLAQNMPELLSVALEVWPENIFWRTVEKSKVQSGPDVPVPAIVFDQAETRSLILQALGAWSMKRWDVASSIVQEIQPLELKIFWQGFGELLEKGQYPPSSLEVLEKKGCLKAVGFSRLVLSDLSLLKETWFIPLLDDPAWQDYRAELTALSLVEAQERIESEKKGFFLSVDHKATLQLLAVAHALTLDEEQKAKSLLQQQNSKKLPLTLEFALGIIDSNSDEMRSDEMRSSGLSPLQRGVLSAVYPSNISLSNAPFWLHIQEKKKDDGVDQWAFDRELTYALLVRDWNKSQTPAVAKRLGLLYPETSTGFNALLFLARQAHGLGRKDLAWVYVNRISEKNLPKDREPEYLDARAGLEMEMGWDDRALTTYSLLLERYPEKLSPEKKIKLALLGQQKGQWKWAQGVLTNLWNEKSKLPPALQAEILFWLGEGAQNQGQQVISLRHYLELAWAYPKQNIWATTALYRAALVYESQGNTAAAKKLLSEVIQKADRKSQKEAAMERLKMLEAKSPPPATGQDRGVLYPF